MAGKVKSAKSDLDAFMTLVRKRYDEAVDADRHNRESGIEDARFESDTTGEGQWPDQVRRERLRDRRPMLTINRLRSVVRQVSNELRMQPPAINVSPAEDGDSETAFVLGGLIRSIEQLSKAKRIYARAGEDSARSNQGHWRVTTQYASDEVFHQEIRIKPIANQFSVLWDPNAVESTKEDARFCFVFEDMPRDEFLAQFGEKVQTDFYNDGRDIYADWITRDTIRIAEYWCVEAEKATLQLLSNGSTVYADDKKAQAWAAGLGLGVVATRETERKKVVMYRVSGHEILDGPHAWPGKRIPIISVWGEEARIGTRRIRNSVITFAKDPQRMLNYWRSTSVERIALAPKAPWLITANQVKGHENRWAQAAEGNPAYLVYSPDPQAPGVAPQRIAPAAVEAAMLQESAIASEDLKATTGIYDASLGAKSNETSGKAIIARQREGDVGTFVFIDNVLDAIEETGRIIVDLIPYIYDTPRQVRILGKKLEPMIVKVNQEGGYDLTRGKYDVVVSTGPSVTTQRQETASILTEALQAAPMLAPAILPRLAQVIELPDADEFAAEVKQLLQPPPPQPQPPNPKDLAQADKYAAEATGQKLQNTADAAQLAIAFRAHPQFASVLGAAPAASPPLGEGAFGPDQAGAPAVMPG